MKANELMIGDLINAFGVVRRVTSIHGLERPEDDGMLTTMVPGCEFPESNLSFRPCYAQPIPLTGEILEKNGFKKDERNENYYKWNWYILEDNASYDMETGIVRIFKASNLTFCHPIGYVHELQNALRLCEVDKEIIL